MRLDHDRTMYKDQVKGRAKEVAGKVKQVTGKAIGNSSLELKGIAEKAVGNIQKNLGDARNNAKKPH